MRADVPDRRLRKVSFLAATLYAIGVLGYVAFAYISEEKNILQGVDDQLKLAASDQNDHQHQRQNEEHVQRVLADVPTADREYGVGIESFGEVPCLFDELVERLAHLRSSQPFQ